MTGFKELIKKAIDANPQSQLAKLSEEAEHKKELADLGKRFRQVGFSWNNHIVNDASNVTIESNLRQKWQELLPEFANSTENERLSMLNWFANGLGISEEKPKDLGAYSVYPLDAYQKMRSGKNFSQASMFLMEIVSDIFGFNENQKNSFRNSINSSMNNRKDIKGHVKLNQTFPGIAQFIVRQHNESRQSPRLS